MLASCAGDEAETALQHVDDVTSAIDRVAPEPASDFHVLQVDGDRPWTGLAPLDAPAPLLPEALRTDDAVSLPLAGPTDDVAMAALIKAATGIAIRFAGARPHDAPPDPFEYAALALPEGGIWSGPLDVLLDAWTSTRGYTWTFAPDTGTATVTRALAVVFRLNALAGIQSIEGSTSTSESGGDGGSTALARQALSSTASYDPWSNIDAQLTALLDPSARVAASPATASLTVTGLPRDIERARNYLDWLNRSALRPVTVSFAVYSVQYSDAAQYELGVGGVLSRVLGASTGIEVLSRGISIVQPAPSEDSFAATVGALETAGIVSRELSATVPSLNAQPAQFFELFSEAYLREVSTTVSEGLLQTELVPGNVSSGFGMTFVAQIVAPHEILLRLFASILDRPQFEVFSTGALRLQLPSYGNRAIQITQRIGRGETLVISGFRDRGTSTGNEGTFDADVPLPFGGETVADALTEQVLLVRAVAGEPLGIGERRGEEL